MLQYDVTITGAVDPDRDEKLAGTLGMPTTYNGSKDIARSNMRFHAVIDQLGYWGPVFKITNIVVTGRAQNTAATSISFSLEYYRDRPSYLRIEDSANPGTYLEGADAIKRMIAYAISKDYNQNYSFWDPTVRVTRTNTNTTSQTTPPRGWAYEMVDATKLYANIAAAEAAITVTQI